MAKNRLLAKVSGNILFFSGLSVVLAFFVIAVFAPYIATHDPTYIDFDSVFLPPSAETLFRYGRSWT